MDEQFEVSQWHGHCIAWRERFAIMLGPDRSIETMSKFRTVSVAR